MKSKYIIGLVSLFCALNVQSQEVQFGDNIENNLLGYDNDLHITSNDEFYVGAIDRDNDRLKLFKKENSAWNLIGPGGGYLEDDVSNVRLESSITGDSLYIVYAKDDGVYVVIYDGATFGSPFYFSGSVPSSSSGSNGMITLINPNNAVVYIMISMNNQYKFLEFDPVLGITALSDPIQHSHFFGSYIDMAYDTTNDYIYFSVMVNDNPAITLYNGTNWVPYIVNISGQSLAFYSGSSLHVDESQNRLYVCAAFHYNGMYYQRVCYVNLTTNGITVLDDQINTTYYVELNGGLYNETNNDIILGMKGLIGNNDYSIKFYNGTTTGIAIQSATMDSESRIQNDSDGNIYWTGDDIYLKVFKLDKFTVELKENESISIETFPNPTSDIINISWNGNIGENMLLLYDINGALILSEQINSESGFHAIDVAGLPSGSYVLKFGAQTKKIQKR